MAFASETPMFSSAVRRTFRAVAVTVVPEAASLGEAEWLELESIVARALAGRPRRQQRQLALFLRVLDLLAVVRHTRRLHSLDAARRERFLERIQDSRFLLVRRGFWGLRTLVLLGYYGRAGAAAEIGYRADPRGWQAKR
jgi:hypothetical protein